MGKFSTIRISNEAKARLAEVREHLATQAGTPVSPPTALAVSIDMMHRIQTDNDLAILSRKQMLGVAHRIGTVLNKRNAEAVCALVRELTGIEPEIVASHDGRTYTIRLDGKAVVLADAAGDLPAAFGVSPLH